MANRYFKKPEDAKNFWWDEIKENFGKFDLVETEPKPFGKSQKNRNLRKIENPIPRKLAANSREKYSEGQKPALVLDFAKIGPDIFMVVVNGVQIVVQKQATSKKWSAQAYFRTWKTPVFDADDPASAVKRLVNYPRWFLHRVSMEWWSLGKLYRLVHFVFPFGKRKRMPAKGTFDREFSACKHVAGHFAWNPAPTRTPRPDEPIKPAQISLPVTKQKEWPKMSDAKYVIIGGVLHTRDQIEREERESESLNRI